MSFVNRSICLYNRLGFWLDTKRMLLLLYTFNSFPRRNVFNIAWNSSNNIICSILIIRLQMKSRKTEQFLTTNPIAMRFITKALVLSSHNLWPPPLPRPLHHLWTTPYQTSKSFTFWFRDFVSIWALLTAPYTKVMRDTRQEKTNYYLCHWKKAHH